MAWQFAFQDQFGATHSEAYANVADFSVNRRARSMAANFAIYVNRAAYVAGKPAIGSARVSCDGDGRVLQPEVRSPNTNAVLQPKITGPSFEDAVAMDADGVSAYDRTAKIIYELSKSEAVFKDAVAV